MSFLSTIIRLVQNAGVVVIASNILSFDTFSHYIFGVTVAGLLCLIVDAGSYNKILATDLSNINSYVQESLVVRCSIYSIVILSMLSVNLILNSLDWMFIIAVFITFQASALETYYIAIKVKKKFSLELTIIFFQFLMIFVSLYLLSVGVMGQIMAFLFPRTILMLLILIFNWSNINNWWTDTYPKKIYEHFKNQWDYSVDSIFSGLNMNINQYIITYYLGKESLTIYQSANKIYLAFISLAGAIGAIIIPKAKNRNEKKDVIKIIMIPFMLFGGLLFFIHLTLSEIVSNALFTFPVKLNEEVFFVLSLFILIRYMSAGAGSSLMICGMQKIRAKINVLINIFTIAISLFIGLFIKYDIIGILYVVLLSQLMMFISYLWFIFKVYND